MQIYDDNSLTITQRAGDVSVAYTIYLKDRRVVHTETVGDLSADNEIDYDSLPNSILKAYQAWIVNLDV